MANEDEVTKPSPRPDPRAEPPPASSRTLESMPSQPDAKKTVNLPAMTDRAILEDLARSMREMQTGVGKLALNVDTLMGDHKGLHERVGGIEGRLARLESPSNPPPSPLTSTRVAAIIDSHPSAMDLNLQAAQAAEIIKNQERDKKIEETHALAAKAAEVLAQQSDYMGMGKKGAQWLFSEKSRTAMAQAAAGLVAAYEVLKHGGLLK